MHFALDGQFRDHFQAQREKARMWIRKRRESLVQDLYETVEDLRVLADQLMELSLEMAKKDLRREAQSTTRMVLTVQEREAVLRKHADRLSKTGNLGRRVTDHLQERALQATGDTGPMA